MAEILDEMSPMVCSTLTESLQVMEMKIQTKDPAH